MDPVTQHCNKLSASTPAFPEPHTHRVGWFGVSDRQFNPTRSDNPAVNKRIPPHTLPSLASPPRRERAQHAKRNASSSHLRLIRWRPSPPPRPHRPPSRRLPPPQRHRPYPPTPVRSGRSSRGTTRPGAPPLPPPRGRGSDPSRASTMPPSSALLRRKTTPPTPSTS
jgi:hypothetical protein